MPDIGQENKIKKDLQLRSFKLIQTPVDGSIPFLRVRAMSQSSARFPSCDDKYYWSAQPRFLQRPFTSRKTDLERAGSSGKLLRPGRAGSSLQSQAHSSGRGPLAPGCGTEVGAEGGGGHVSDGRPARPRPGQARGAKQAQSPDTPGGKQSAPGSTPRGG